MNEQYVAIRSFTASGRSYKIGEVVDTTDWPFRREKLMLEQRYIRVVNPAHRQFIVQKEMTLGDITYKVGDIILYSTLVAKHKGHLGFNPRAKLDQLVDRRWLKIDDTSRMAASDKTTDGKGVVA